VKKLLAFKIALLGLIGVSSVGAQAGQSAPASAHWSFIAPQRPALPEVKNQKWVRNEIDAFVLARLEKEDIKPSPEADRRTLIRRLSLDLLGLPPSLQEVETFVNDKSRDAYEQAVDRLLASPHFGEQWGRHWLDLARYADSDGYEKDTVRAYAWLYRDWVIDALNRDLPFDEFTIEQLAGDLLPDATRDKKIATGFHRNTLTNKEGGVDQEEFRCKAVSDRVNTTGSVWLGLTVGCAECHNHKYDPISQREYYQLFAFYNTAVEQDLPAPQPAELEKYHQDKQQWDATNAKLKETLAAYLQNEFPTSQSNWEHSVKLPDERWTALEPKHAASTEGATLTVQSDKSLLASDKNPATDTYRIETETDVKGITGFRLEVLKDADSAKGTGRSKDGNFVLSEFTAQILVSSNQTNFVSLKNPSTDFSQKDHDITAAIDGDPKTGWSVKGQVERRHVAVFETDEPFDVPAGAKLVFTLNQQDGSEHTLARFRLSATKSPRPLKADLMPDAVLSILETNAAERTEKQKAELVKYFREEIDPTTTKLDEQLAAHIRTEPRFPETKAQTLAENDKPPSTHVHVRGDFLRQGEEVHPATLSVLHPFKPRGAKPDRLDFARWLFDPANPLTRRVAVNQMWLQLFGRALVSTVNDFGTRGEKPSHPELLDWLATEFPRQAWSRKTMIKLIVTSATYRQSSNARPELLDRDPNNILLARQNRFRLEAENVRDVYLSTSGLLNPAVGGPSVRPPLPADIAAIGYANSVKWAESQGTEKYRRGLYILFQRTVPYPMLMTFDAPDSNVTCTRRERSNTPLQALTLLNDPVFFECAQALGRRMASEPATQLGEKLERGFEWCLLREPTKAELARLEKLYAEQLRAVESHPENASKIAGVSSTDSSNAIKTATLVAVARTLMNLDEFVTKE